MLANILSRYWGMTLLRGTISILLSLVIFTQPGIALVTLTLLFGTFVLADGVARVVSAVGGREENEHWWALLLAGLAGIAVGILTFFNPGITTLALLFYIAIWAIATGLLEMVTAIRLRKEIEGEYWLILAGLVSVAFGFFIMASPGQGAMSVLWLIGTYGFVFGLILIILAFRARGFVNRVMTGVKG